MDPRLNGCPAIPHLEVYVPPLSGRQYILGADPAEGNPTSDDSALTVLDVLTGEECAALADKIQPEVFASYIDLIGRWYNAAAIMLEKNNHGWGVLAWLHGNSRLRILNGHDGKEGWNSNALGKTLMYDACASAFKDESTILHSFATYMQLSSIEGSSLLAPKGEHDDRADSYALALVGRSSAVSWSFDAIGGAGKRTESRWKPPS